MNLLRSNNLHVQEAQQNPIRVKCKEIHKQINHNKSSESQRQGETIEILKALREKRCIT